MCDKRPKLALGEEHTFFKILDVRSFIKHTFLIILCMCIVYCVSARDIRGVIKDINDGSVIENVMVLAKADRFEMNAFSDSEGVFFIKIPAEITSVKLIFSHISYLSKEIDVCVDSVLTVFLEPKDNMLNEIMIKPDLISKKDGNTIVNVQQIPNVDKLQADQVLRYIPGIIKNSNGNYSLNGKSAVILINGIKQSVSASSLGVFLSNLPADVISSIELVSVNTGKYASSVEAVIDINTNSNVRLGYSFQPCIFSSFIPKELNNIGGDLFYMVKRHRILFHNSLTYSNDNCKDERTDSLLMNGIRLLSNRALTNGRNNILTYHGSLIYYFDNDNTLNINTFMYNDFGEKHSLWSFVNKKKFEDRKDRSDLYNISIAYTIPSYKQGFNGIISYAISYGGQHSKLDYLSDNNHVPKGNACLDMEGWMHTWNADFSSKFNCVQLSYGFQIDRNSVWDKTVYQYKTKANRNLTKFTGAELLFGIYAQCKYSFNEKISLRFGARLENTSYHYKHHSQNKKFNNKSNLFPSLLLYYDSKNYNLIFGLTSNISRPKYEWIIPSERVLNDYIHTIGNPDIQSSRVYGIVLYNTIFKYAQLNFSYVVINNLIDNVYSTEKGQLIQSKNNIANEHYFRVNAVLPFALLRKKLTGQLQINTSYNKLLSIKNGFVLPEGRKPSYWETYYATVVNYFPTDRLNISVQGVYRPMFSATTYTKNKNMNLDIEMYYSFMKEKNLTLSLRALDIFAKDRAKCSYFLNNQHHSIMKELGPIFQISLKLKLNKGEKVIEEYKDYKPNISRFLR